MTSVARLLAGRFGALADVFRNDQLRRLQLSGGMHWAGDWAQFVALSVYVYEADGTTALGLLGLIRMVPAAAASPFGSALVDRYPRERVLAGIHLARAVAMGVLAAVLAVGAPLAVVYVLAALTAIAAAPLRPAQWSLVPLLARSPEELVAANVSSSSLEGIATIVGPAAAGVLLEFERPDVVLAATTVLSLWCAALVVRMRHAAGSTPRARGTSGAHALFAGARAVFGAADVRLLIGLGAAQTFVRGLLNVLVVAAALTILKMGEAGAGFLNSAYGVGGLVGAFATMTLVGRRRFAGPFALSLVLWGAPVALVGAWPQPVFALVCLGVVGAGNSLLDISIVTLLQRAVDDDIQGRVFGMLEILVLASTGVGSILAALIVAEVGVRWALVISGGTLPLLAAIFLKRLRGIDRSTDVPARPLGLLGSMALFAPLPVTTLERLARRVKPLHVPVGTAVVREGDPAGSFYAIAHGEVDVMRDGARVRRLNPGDHFGEIALLHDVPRTASCLAATDVDLYVLDETSFVSAVMGHAGSSKHAEMVVRSRLAGDADSGGPRD